MTTLLKTPGTSQGTTQRAPDQEVGPAHRPDPDGPPVVVRDVRRSYGDREVLHGVDLVVERGSFHGVIGSNGAGKTTLMEIVHGARRPSSGTVELLGRPPLPRDLALLARLGIQPAPGHGLLLPRHRARAPGHNGRALRRLPGPGRRAH